MELRTLVGPRRLDPAAAVPLAAALAAEPDLFTRLAALRAAVAAAGDALQPRLRLQAELAARAPLLALAPGCPPLAGRVPTVAELPALAVALAHLGRYRRFFAELRARLEHRAPRLDPRTAALVQEALTAGVALIRPAAVVALARAVFDPDGVTVGPLRIVSRDVPRWFAARAGGGAPESALESAPESARVVLFAGTLGPALDEEISRRSRRAPAAALALNAFGAAAAELLAEDLTLTLGPELPGSAPLRRYHAGYGDWEPRAQAPLLALLEAEARLGLRLTAAGMMLPEKSVSGLLARRIAPALAPA